MPFEAGQDSAAWDVEAGVLVDVDIAVDVDVDLVVDLVVVEEELVLEVADFVLITGVLAGFVAVDDDSVDDAFVGRFCLDRR